MFNVKYNNQVLGKALFFMLRPPNEGTQITGGTRSTLYILENLKQFKPFVLTTNAKDILISELKRLHIGHEVLEGDYPFNNFMDKSLRDKIKTLINLIVYNLKVLKVIKRINPDIVHCSAEKGSYSILLATKIARKKLVIYVRNTPRNQKLRIIHQIPMLFADNLIAISKGLKELIRLQGWSFIRNRITHIYNGIDIEEMRFFMESNSKDKIREELGIQKEKVAVGIVAFISPLKRQKEFLEQVACEMNSNNISFYFIGGVRNQQYMNECLEVVRNNGLEDKVIFTGYREDVFKWYRALDIVALPSEREGVPRTLIEAQVLRIPVVGFNILGTKEAVINGKTGFLVNSFDELKDYIVKLAEDEDLRIDMGEEGEKFVIEHFDIKRNTERLEDVYQQLLEPNPSF